MAPKQLKENVLNLPLSIVSQTDVARLMREVENFQEKLVEARLRPGASAAALPPTSQQLADFLTLNHFDLTASSDQQRLGKFFKELKSQAPLLHISFAADPPPKVVYRVVAWLRQEIHPLTLLQIGLQPDIAAGFILRTPNRFIDCSLRQNFGRHRDLLIASLREGYARP